MLTRLCWNRLLRLFLSPYDSELQYTRKLVMLAATCGACAMLLCLPLVDATLMTGVGFVFVGAGSGTTLVYLLATKQTRPAVIHTVMGGNKTGSAGAPPVGWQRTEGKMLTRLCWNRLLRLFLTPYDSELQYTRKLVMLAATCGACAMLLCLLLVDATLMTGVGFVFVGAGSGTTLVYLLSTKQMPPAVIHTVMVLYVAAVLVFDLAAVSHSAARSWPLLLVLSDVLVICKTKVRPEHVLVVSLMWTAVVFFELTFSFGLTDAPGLLSQEQRRDAVTSCDRLPCRPVKQLVVEAGEAAGVLVIGFLSSRRLAWQLEGEKEKVRTIVEFVHEVTEALSRFDLNEAEHLVDSKHAEGLQRSFTSLLDNLRKYKRYLPESLVQQIQTAARLSTVEKNLAMVRMLETEPPGSGDVTLVFTDIQSSTRLWELYPDSMAAALVVHDEVIRSACYAYGGYEVKTIGDAFMIAFEKSEHAVAFALTAQEELCDSCWPIDVLVPEGDETAEMDTMDLVDECCVWNGLRVRIGAHCGPAQTHKNPLTNRTDYFGPTVNVAARVEHLAVGGFIAATSEVVDRALDAWSADLPLIMSQGKHAVKGCAEPFNIYFLLPMSLAARRFILDRPAEPTTELELGNQHTLPSEPLSITIDDSTVVSTHMRSGSATVCLLRSFGPASVDSLSTVLLLSADYIHRTGGVLASASGSGILGAWNASKPCSAHLLSAVRCLTMLTEYLRSTQWKDMHGIAVVTGPTDFGSIMARTQAYVITMGSSVHVAEAAVSALRNSGIGCLAASLPGHLTLAHDRRYEGLLRPVDEREGVVFYEVRTLLLRDRFVFDVPEDWAWGTEYEKAFFAADSALLMARAEGDAVVAGVARRLADKQHLVPPLFLSASLSGSIPSIADAAFL
ncbi:Adenylate cyclase [Diplonema papillatum]|nr:Adenylate cyclase [Diplonema papillatum]